MGASPHISARPGALPPHLAGVRAVLAIGAPEPRRNQRPQSGAGHTGAQRMMPAASRANYCQMAAMSSVGR
jgi:hypothetical protein